MTHLQLALHIDGITVDGDHTKGARMNLVIVELPLRCVVFVHLTLKSLLSRCSRRQLQDRKLTLVVMEILEITSTLSKFFGRLGRVLQRAMRRFWRKEIL
jgi:hypothetical protein